MLRHRSPAALLLLASLCACAEEHHYAVNLRGEARRVDADGNPLPGESLPDPAAPAGPLRGTLQLDASLQVDPERFACVFIIAGRGGAMEVADRLDQPHFPLEFALGEKGPHGSAPGPGDYRVQAWLDSDGDAEKRPGDVIGEAISPARPGGAPVLVVLDRVLTAADLPAAAGAAPVPVAPFDGGAPAGGPTPEDLAGPRFRGTVELAPEFAELDGRHTLFIILRSPQTERGMPLAVRRVDSARFPLEFDVGAEDVPLDVDNKAEILGGQVKVTARLSVSGQAIGGAGDVESAPLVTGPGSGLLLRLDTRRSP